MGRVKSVAIKGLGRDLMSKHDGKFGLTFDENKVALRSIMKIESKKVRNVLAGYITRKMVSRKAGIPDHPTAPPKVRKESRRR